MRGRSAQHAEGLRASAGDGVVEANGTPPVTTSRQGEPFGSTPGWDGAEAAILPQEVLSACSAALAGMSGGARTSVAVTSCASGEGRTLIAAGLASVISDEYERPTLILDLDRKAGAVQAPGLAEVMRGDASLDDCIRWLGQGLGEVGPGSYSSTTPTFLSQLRSSGVLAELRQAGYSLVGDLPPLPPHGHADLALPGFSVSVVVVRAGVVPAAALRRAVQGLPEPVTVFLNGRVSAVPGWARRLVGD